MNDSTAWMFALGASLLASCGGGGGGDGGGGGGPTPPVARAYYVNTSLSGSQTLYQKRLDGDPSPEFVVPLEGTVDSVSLGIGNRALVRGGNAILSLGGAVDDVRVLVPGDRGLTILEGASGTDWYVARNEWLFFRATNPSGVTQLWRVRADSPNTLQAVPDSEGVTRFIGTPGDNIAFESSAGDSYVAWFDVATGTTRRNDAADFVHFATEGDTYLIVGAPNRRTWALDTSSQQSFDTPELVFLDLDIATVHASAGRYVGFGTNTIAIRTLGTALAVTQYFPVGFTAQRVFEDGWVIYSVRGAVGSIRLGESGTPERLLNASGPLVGANDRARIYRAADRVYWFDDAGVLWSNLIDGTGQPQATGVQNAPVVLEHRDTPTCWEHDDVSPVPNGSRVLLAEEVPDRLVAMAQDGLYGITAGTEVLLNTQSPILPDFLANDRPARTGSVYWFVDANGALATVDPTRGGSDMVLDATFRYGTATVTTLCGTSSLLLTLQDDTLTAFDAALPGSRTAIGSARSVLELEPARVFFTDPQSNIMTAPVRVDGVSPTVTRINSIASVSSRFLGSY